MREQTFMKLMRVLPKSAISAAVGAATRLPAPPTLHRAAMRAFARRYNVDVHEAEHDFDGYDNFSEFFARRLKPGLRPIDPGDDVIVSPVDGAVSQAGYSLDGQMIQAKGIDYPVAMLLGDEAAATPFRNGAFATLYLSPRDYHRIHTPLAGKVTGYSYIPGQFWPVNRASVRFMPHLFAINERLITYMDTTLGKVAVVKVGATCVSRIKVTYDDGICTHLGEPTRVHAYQSPIPMEKGQELGRFEMGSTVILLFEDGKIRWDAGLEPEAVVRMGKRIGAET